MIASPKFEALAKVGWTLKSKKDPRFTTMGSAVSLTEAEHLMDTWILELAYSLKIEPPDDIEMCAVKA